MKVRFLLLVSLCILLTQSLHAQEANIIGWVYGYFLDLFIEIRHEGNRFRLSPSLADSVDIRQEKGFQDGYSGVYYPPHCVYTLGGYHLAEVSEKNRCIYIYPLEEHAGNQPDRKSVGRERVCHRV